MKTQTRFLLLLLALLISGIGSAAEEPATALLDAARRAGTAASPLVFDDEVNAGQDAQTGRRISGKAVVLATAIASAALVTSVWLITRGRNACEPNADYSTKLWLWTDLVSRQEPGSTPVPLFPPPRERDRLPALCVMGR